jgi:predicted molibdopterin-dependent oxidoreductase YjgC
MSRYADVLLPGVSFAETTGTYTNTERRIQMVRQAIEPQGDSKPAWKILSELARRICPQAERHLVDGICPGWDYTNTAEIMDEIAALTPIYAGVSHKRLERGDALRWPVESEQHPGTQTLFVSEFVHGRGSFMPVGEHSVAESQKT